MLNTVPIGSERQPLPVNPIQYRKVQPLSSRKPPRRAEPPAPVRAVPDRRNQEPHASLEHLYLLSAETRRSLLDLDPENPLSGPHPTD